VKRLLQNIELPAEKRQRKKNQNRLCEGMELSPFANFGLVEQKLNNLVCCLNEIVYADLLKLLVLTYWRIISSVGNPLELARNTHRVVSLPTFQPTGDGIGDTWPLEHPFFVALSAMPGEDAQPPMVYVCGNFGPTVKENDVYVVRKSVFYILVNRTGLLNVRITPCAPAAEVSYFSDMEKHPLIKVTASDTLLARRLKIPDVPYGCTLWRVPPLRGYRFDYLVWATVYGPDLTIQLPLRVEKLGIPYTGTHFLSDVSMI